jgi:predicted RNase H-like HicB family nuclease
MKSCNLSVLAEPARSIPGAWVAHCLNLDIVSQGTSLEEAMEAIVEAIVMSVGADLSEGLDPFDVRPKAPDEDWNRFLHVVKNGRSLQSIEDRSQLAAVIAQVMVVRPLVPGVDAELEKSVLLPEAWQLAAVEELRQSQRAH